MLRVARWLLTTLLAIGFAYGLIHYVHEDGPHGLEQLGKAIVGGVAAVTYRWVPPTITFVANVISNLSKAV